MNWNNHSREMPEGAHSILSPSQYAWFNYDDDKLVQFFVNRLVTERGTKLHDLACRLIKLHVPLPDTHETLNMYVNDAIDLNMDPEVKLYYSKYCFGTADSIGINKGVLRVHDLKTGKNKASFMQLHIYVALFFLEYQQYRLDEFEKIVTRIYQNNEIREEVLEADDVLPIMDRIVRCSRILTGLEEKYAN